MNFVDGRLGYIHDHTAFLIEYIDNAVDRTSRGAAVSRGKALLVDGVEKLANSAALMSIGVTLPIFPLRRMVTTWAISPESA